MSRPNTALNFTSSLPKVAEHAETVQFRQGCYVARIEEVAFRWRFIGADEFRLLGEEMSKTDYGRHFISILDEAGRA